MRTFLLGSMMIKNSFPRVWFAFRPWAKIGRAVIVIVFAFLSVSQVAQARDLSIVRDDEWDEFFFNYAEPLVRAAGLDAQEMRYFLVSDRTPNAFVMAGRDVFIHTGLIVSLPQGGQLLAVLAHELAHIASGDVASIGLVAQQQPKKILLSTLVGIAGGALLGVAAPAILGLGFGLQSAGADITVAIRMNEQEADQSAAYYLAQSGYSPLLMADALEALSQFEPIVRGSAELFSTHPITSSRIQAVKDAQVLISASSASAPTDVGATSNENSDLVGARAMEKAYARIRAKILAYSQSQHQGQRRVTKRDTPDFDEQEEHLLAPRLYRDLNILIRIKKADEALDMIASLRDIWGKDDIYLTELEAEAWLLKQDYQKAITLLRQALKQSPEALMMRYRLADTYFRVQTPDTDAAAMREYRVIVKRDKGFLLALNRLAVLARRTNNDILFHLARAEYHLQKGLKAQARESAQKALSYAQSYAHDQAQDGSLSDAVQQDQQRAQDIIDILRNPS